MAKEAARAVEQQSSEMAVATGAGRQSGMEAHLDSGEDIPRCTIGARSRETFLQDGGAIRASIGDGDGECE